MNIFSKAPSNRRRFLARIGLGCAGAIQFGLRHAVGAESAPATVWPELHFEKPESNALHGTSFRNALRNLLVTNTVADTKGQYHRTGLFRDPPGRFIRAGGDYATPWTRDASINAWNAASLLAPDVARNTLWAVCERQANGRLIIQRDPARRRGPAHRGIFAERQDRTVRVPLRETDGRTRGQCPGWTGLIVQTTVPPARHAKGREEEIAFGGW